jgi:hypothetical protein
MPSFSGGKRIFHAFGALAEFEPYLIKERIGRGFKPRAPQKGKVADLAGLMRRKSRRWVRSMRTRTILKKRSSIHLLFRGVSSTGRVCFTSTNKCDGSVTPLMLRLSHVDHIQNIVWAGQTQLGRSSIHIFNPRCAIPLLCDRDVCNRNPYCWLHQYGYIRAIRNRDSHCLRLRLLPLRLSPVFEPHKHTHAYRHLDTAAT